MAHIMSLRELQEIYVFMLAQYQSFSMSFIDAISLSNGIDLAYGIDAYDLSTYIFPLEFHLSAPNPYREAIHARWHTFFNHSLGRKVYATISPLTLVELLSMIEHRSGERALLRVVRARYKEIFDLLDKISKMPPLSESVEKDDILIIKKIYYRMMASKTLNRILRDKSLFGEIRSLIDDGKVKLWDVVLKESNGARVAQGLFKYDQERIRRGIQYLINKDRSRDSSYIDVYNYVIYDNLQQLRSEKGAKVYITSSGVLSQNAWVITKYGSFLDDLEGIPEDWSARAAHAPSYLARAYSHFNSDLERIIQFFEEGKTLSRVALRDLLSIKEIESSINNPRERRKLYKANPDIRIRNSVGQALLRFQNDYYRIVAPTIVEQMTAMPDIPYDDIDVKALKDWMKDPKKRGKVYQESVGLIRDELHDLQLIPSGWHYYVAPIGKSAYEIMSLFTR
jgi:hypothetical protein